MRKNLTGILVVVGMAAAAVALPDPARWPGPAAAEKTGSGGPAVPVTPGTVALADVPVLLNGIGTVQAYNMVLIKSRVDGQVVKADFTEGQEVKAGAPLFQIDPRPYQATLDQALATKEKDEATLANAQRNMARDAQIINSHLAVSQQQFDNDKAAVAAGQALVDADKAQVEAARLNLGYATITAPISGRLGARLVDVGNIVHASDAGGLVTIAQLRPIYVSFTLPQEDAHKLREKQAIAPLDVRAFGGDNKTLLATGKLSLIDNTIDQATGTIRLKATFANADERLWPGEFVNAQVVLTVRQGVPTVPAQTVQEGAEGRYVYVIKKDDTVERRPVEVTAAANGVAVIQKGLSPGERVVVEGQYRLTDGTRVRLLAPARGAAS